MLWFSDAGQRIYVRHVRDGSELATIGKDDYYDANYQNARELVPARKVLQVQWTCFLVF